MKLTERQKAVLEEMRKIGRDKLYRYRESSPYLFGLDCQKVKEGDESCCFGMGALSYQVGSRLGMTAASALSTFKTLEKKGLVIRENHRGYLSPLYWWPVGLADELAKELEC